MTEDVKGIAERVCDARIQTLASMRAWVEAEAAVIAMQVDATHRLAASEATPVDAERRAALIVLQREVCYREWERARQGLRELEFELYAALDAMGAKP